MPEPTTSATSANREPRLVHDLVRFSLVSGLAVWIGGLTFYAAFVVPVGIKMFGSVPQGFATQRATASLNLIGVCVLAMLLAHAIRTRCRSFWLTWSALALVQALLFLQHGRLTAGLDPTTQSINAADFYDQHRLYLLLTAAQWLLGWTQLWLVLRNSSPK
jgi:hypothetical protein